MEPPHRQLLLVKYLFQRGEDTLAEQSMFAAGMAVSLFQDAVEALIWTIAKEVEAESGDRGFEASWNAIKQAKKNVEHKELPLKGKMVELNKARVGFKHYGIVPSAEAAAHCHHYTGQFLTAACRDFFAVDFATVSLVDLIQSKSAAAHLRLAEKAHIDGNPGTALEECAKAYHYLAKPLAALVGPAQTFDQERQAINQAVRPIRDLALISSLRLPLVDFLRFRSVIPGAMKFGGNEFQLTSWAGRSRRPEDAAFAVKFLTDYGIAVQEALRTLHPEERARLFADGET